MAEFPEYAYILWDNICDIVGDSENWPTKIKKLFWSKNVRHFERLMCAFCYINGLNPVVFLDWVDIVGLCRDESARREIVNWFHEFETNKKKCHKIYQYNIFNHQYEYLNGEVKSRLKLTTKHP